MEFPIFLWRDIGEHMNDSSLISLAHTSPFIYDQLYGLLLKRFSFWDFTRFASVGNLTVLQWLKDNDSVPEFFTEVALESAAEYGHLHVCQWLVQQFKFTRKFR